MYEVTGLGIASNRDAMSKRRREKVICPNSMYGVLESVRAQEVGQEYELDGKIRIPHYLIEGHDYWVEATAAAW